MLEAGKERVSLYLSVDRRNVDVVYSLFLLSSSYNKVLFSKTVREGDGKDSAFSELMYELMRLDALYDIPVSTQIDILYHMVIEENLEVSI